MDKEKVINKLIRKYIRNGETNGYSCTKVKCLPIRLKKVYNFDAYQVEDMMLELIKIIENAIQKI